MDEYTIRTLERLSVLETHLSNIDTLLVAISRNIEIQNAKTEELAKLCERQKVLFWIFGATTLLSIVAGVILKVVG